MAAPAVLIAVPVEKEQATAVPPPGKMAAVAPRGANWFSQALLEMSSTRPKRRAVDVTASVAFHVLLLSALVLVPLYFSDPIDMKQFVQTLLVALPPPPPPPPAAPDVVRTTTSARRIFSSGKLLAPAAIPQRVVILKEETVAPEIGGAGDGVLGGVPGGQAGGVIGGVIWSVRTTVPAAPATVERKMPVRAGGHVKEPRVIYKVEPVYPTLAKQAHVQGTVVINAIIDEQGNVIEMQVVSGPVLLIDAAMRALRSWKYEPTRLNGEPISVDLTVRVNFQLS